MSLINPIVGQKTGEKVKSKYNAIIVGAGIIGCSIALELSRNSSFSVLG